MIWRPTAPQKPHTLRTYRDERRPLDVSCKGCGRKRMVEPHLIRAPLDVPLHAINHANLRCSRCGGRKISLWPVDDRELRKRGYYGAR